VHARSIGPLLVCVATKQHPVSCPGSFAQRAVQVAGPARGVIWQPRASQERA
jgi:hypothetical protein